MALTFPSSPSNGQYYTDTATGNRYVYNSSVGAWIIAANNVGMSVSSTPPGNVAPGALWFNREIGRTFLYYDDGDSKQWVETVPATGFFDSSTVASYANVAAQIYYTPVYNTANAAYASINSNWTTTNAAFSKANSALPNTTNAVFQGNLTVTGALTIGTGTTTITTDSINVGNVLVVTSQGMTIPSGNTAQRPASAPLGTIRYNNQTGALENYTTSGWLKVSIPIPGIASLSGSIYYSNTSTLTITGSGFGTAQGNVTFTSGATVAYSNATPTNDASVSFTVPSEIYNLAVGSSVSIKYTNNDGGISGSVTTSVLSLPTGGTITTSGGYRYHTFTSSGSFVVPNNSVSIDATFVAGGGGGARNRGGGGGAGGMITYTSIGTAVGTYTVTIGAGGQPQTAVQDSGQGNATTVVGGAISWSATGGGRGGGNGYGTNYAGGSGGSGGGAGSTSSQSGGSGTSGQGNAGGSTGGYSSGAGGGGKGSVGGNSTGSTSVPVPGGSGAAGINGVTYAAGGAGGVGADAAGGGANGTANSGNGGDGGSGNVVGGAGGSGIVVIRYALP